MRRGGRRWLARLLALVGRPRAAPPSHPALTGGPWTGITGNLPHRPLGPDDDDGPRRVAAPPRRRWLDRRP